MPRHDSHVNLRAPRELLKRAEGLLPLVRGDDRFIAWPDSTRSSILRLALQRGIEVLEREYSVAGHGQART